MRDDETVTAWALAARGGDADAVERFIRATQSDVRRYVARLSNDPQGADDLVQETFLRALRSLPRFEGRASARTWLLSIARRTVVDRLRFQAARPRLSDTDDWQSAAERTQSAELPGFDEGVALSQLLDRLPYERREAFVLTQMLGLPYAEAAVVAGCPVGTVRSRVARAREALIVQLETAEREATVREATVREAAVRAVTVRAASARPAPKRMAPPGRGVPGRAAAAVHLPERLPVRAPARTPMRVPALAG
ncbi:sigma-70 family RNA polymerase sigma factor [Streptomyces sp. SCA3-4]|nr:sigma-70 family RNA polymerase sigma factor [Streptomyces sichuanensis]MCA6093173.1 sigma-70 family RNA polymerase sigma factor [Streptomyces sichuanensis]